MSLNWNRLHLKSKLSIYHYQRSLEHDGWDVNGKAVVPVGNKFSVGEQAFDNLELAFNFAANGSDEVSVVADNLF
ncbi:hypothetical protein K04M5_49430 (plasmid) [Vibrio alginolyticus]|nr:hypothetical protein K04M5_49430 [Vibrio alginolyticus]